MQSTVLAFDIKTEEPLDLNSDNDEMSSHGSQLTDDEVSLMNTSLTNDIESYEDFSSNDDMPLSSLSHNNLCTSESKFATTKRSVEQFDELVALWRSSLECEICHQLVASYSQLEEHFGKNHASEICYLMCCQLKLESRYDIERHIHYHNAPQRLKCEACCKAYRLEKHLITHKRKVHTSKGGGKNTNYSKKLEGRYRCSKCLKNFATTTSLSAHNRNVHKPKIFECNMCEKSFRRPNALRQHLAVHEGERKHACSVCSKTFTCRAYFCRHMRIYHPQEWKKMQNVKFQTKTRKGYLLVTQGESMVYVCIYCSVEYSKQQSIYSHLKRCRRDGTPIQPKRMYRLVTRGENVVYVCIYCSKEYANRRSMNSHLYRRHKDDRSSAKRTSIISEPPEPSEQQQDSLCTTRIIDPKATDVTNITPDGDTFNMLGKVQEEDSLMAPVEGKELKDENATRIYVKTEQISADTNALGNEEIGDNEMPLEFEDTTWESEEFIKSEEEFIKLQAEI
uniref:C2H2-type domain-containing protein n=1 Tax=Stomoxys calcitrans TaxID=35570 RepID=A0A1I8NSJ5_STOCA